MPYQQFMHDARCTAAHSTADTATLPHNLLSEPPLFPPPCFAASFGRAGQGWSELHDLPSMRLLAAAQVRKSHFTTPALFPEGASSVSEDEVRNTPYGYRIRRP
ncbi:hypothetical protein CABS01_05831 [Colletotrichum abscissum]|uniref:Uncharacterized protein n=1 Tax=Colletotrichum abscissum TaxID=1671311 RepID=A0A9Q0B1R1_9PEZI|nr:uncharacterized protein CABS01_05831 [Colletotrichum abscissum]KAI3544006.1 hypothetical protein CABS02_12384 [Colletotrichum abscissum]KAK1518297.1 hypothetical protein CABS01_05831 [Colletotrichum abscissum]